MVDNIHDREGFSATVFVLVRTRGPRPVLLSSGDAKSPTQTLAGDLLIVLGPTATVERFAALP